MNERVGGMMNDGMEWDGMGWNFLLQIILSSKKIIWSSLAGTPSLGGIENKNIYM